MAHERDTASGPMSPFRLLFATLALALAASASAQPGRLADRPFLDAGYTLTITPTQAPAPRGLQQVRVRVEPRRAAVRAPWQGQLQNLALDDGSAVRKLRLRSCGAGVWCGTTHLARGLRIDRVFLRGSLGGTSTFRVAQEGEDEEPEEPETPEDPPEEDPPEEDPEDPEDEEDEDCTPPPCGGMVDPWTCECYSDMRDPWGVMTSSGRTLTIEF